MILGDKDTIVDNSATQQWHEKTQSQVKEFKRLALTYHELSKEPNSKDFLGHLMTFCQARITAGAKAFGEYDPKKVNIAAPLVKGGAAGGKKKKKWLIILYFLIGLILAIVRRSKKLFLIWPLMPFLKH